jgi:hypothetical protein
MHSTLPESDDSRYDDTEKNNDILGSEDSTQNRHLQFDILILFASIEYTVRFYLLKEKPQYSTSGASYAKQKMRQRIAGRRFYFAMKRFRLQ